MAEPTLDDFVDEAASLADQLLGGPADAESSSPVMLQLADIAHNLRILNIQLYFYRHLGLRVPCVEGGGDPIPIDIDSLRSSVAMSRGDIWMWQDYDLPQFLSRRVDPVDLAQHMQEQFAIFGTRGGEDQNVKIMGVNPDDIGDMIRRPVSRFISNRLLGLFRSKKTASTVTHINFTLRTNTPNLVIYYSGAYFLQLNNYFGAPSSPVTAPIQAGLYVFGGNVAPGIPPRMETHTRFDVPVVLQGQLSTM